MSHLLTTCYHRRIVKLSQGDNPQARVGKDFFFSQLCIRFDVNIKETEWLEKENILVKHDR